MRLSAGVVLVLLCFHEAVGAETAIGRPRLPAASSHMDPRVFAEFEVYFDYNESDIESARGGNAPSSPSGMKSLAENFEALRRNYGKSGYKYDTRRTDRIIITGVADHLGSAANNRKVALNRAKAVRNYLVSRGMDFSNGVSAGRISIGYSLKRTEAKCAHLPRADEVKCMYLDRKAEIRYLRVDVPAHSPAL